jgi:hypothetical protein
VSETDSVARTAPIILLVEDDEFDRMTLTRMLEESGYSVMAAGCADDALHIFSKSHSDIALILASLRLSDAQRIGLIEAVDRVDVRKPVIVARPRPSHRPNSGADSGRLAMFAELIANVQRRLAPSTHTTDHDAPLRVGGANRYAIEGPARSPSSFTGASNPADDFNWSLRDEETDDIEVAPYAEDGAVEHAAVNEEAPHGSAVAAEQPLPTYPRRRIPSLALIDMPDLRSCLAEESRTRRIRQRRLRNIGMVAGAGCLPLVLITLLPAPATRARAIEPDAEAPAPLASTSLSARVGLVPLISGSRLDRSSLADDLIPGLYTGSETAAAPRAQSKRSHAFRVGWK